MQAQFLARCVNAAHAANVRGEFAVSVDWCRQALQLAPDLPEAWYNLGVALRGLGNRAEAIAALERAGARTQNSADAQNNIGLELIELGALPEAERCLTRALVLAPGYAFAHSNMGKLRVKQQRFDEAENAFRRALEQKPDLAPVYVNLGGALNAKRNYGAAEAACRKAIELDPTSADAWRNRATALAGLKQYGPAAECGERCLALDPHAKFIRGAMLHNRMKICDWTSFDANVAELLAGDRAWREGVVSVSGSGTDGRCGRPAQSGGESMLPTNSPSTATWARRANIPGTTGSAWAITRRTSAITRYRS